MNALGWHVISGADLLDALREVAAGADPDLLYAELWANAEHEDVPRNGIPTKTECCGRSDRERATWHLFPFCTIRQAWLALTTQRDKTARPTGTSAPCDPS